MLSNCSRAVKKIKLILLSHIFYSMYREVMYLEIIQKIEFDFSVEMFVLGYADLKKVVF